MQLKQYDQKLIKSRGALVYKEYLELLKSGELLIEIEVVLEKLKMSLTKFISILMQYIEENKTHEDYEEIFDELLRNPNPKEYLRENFIPKEFLSDNLQNYLYYKRPDILFGNKRLLKALNSFVEYNNKLWSKREQQEKYKAEVLPFIENIIKEYLNQEYSLDRFCLLKDVGREYFNPKLGFYIRQISIYNQDLYQKFIERYNTEEKTKQDSIINDIYTMLSIIKEKGFLDAVDIYQSTIYSHSEISEFSNKLLSKEDNRTIQEYINRLKNMFIPTYRNHNLRGELLKEKYTFTLNNAIIETTEEERSIILNFLEKENIPISSIIVFQDACKRYYNNELIPKVRSKKYD